MGQGCLLSVVHGDGETQVAWCVAWWRHWSSTPARQRRCTFRHPPASYVSSPGQPLCPPHQLARPAAATGQEGGGGSQPRDGGGPEGVAAIHGARPRLPKVLADNVGEEACRPAKSALRDAAGTHAATTTPVAAMNMKARIFSCCSSVQPETRVCGGAGHLQIEISDYIL
jgi:hypothetical protein